MIVNEKRIRKLLSAIAGRSSMSSGFSERKIGSKQLIIKRVGRILLVKRFPPSWDRRSRLNPSVRCA